MSMNQGTIESTFSQAKSAAPSTSSRAGNESARSVDGAAPKHAAVPLRRFHPKQGGTSRAALPIPPDDIISKGGRYGAVRSASPESAYAITTPVLFQKTMLAVSNGASPEEIQLVAVPRFFSQGDRDGKGHMDVSYKFRVKI